MCNVIAYYVKGQRAVTNVLKLSLLTLCLFLLTREASVRQACSRTQGRACAATATRVTSATSAGRTRGATTGLASSPGPAAVRTATQGSSATRSCRPPARGPQSGTVGEKPDNNKPVFVRGSRV